MERVQLKRRLTAVLLADVVGYSRLMSVDEEGTHTRLGDCVKHLIEPTVCAYRGQLTRSKGDGLLAEFDSAVDAVRCAVDIQHRLADAGADSNDKLELRIGINSGDVIVDEHDVYGNSVNIASRLEGLAEPGGIYVTEAVREQLLGHPGLCLQGLGERRVKNIDRPIRIYRVVSKLDKDIKNSAGLRVLARLSTRGKSHFGHRAVIISLGVAAAMATIGTAALSMWTARLQLSQQASIMVLPFRNSSGDPSEDYIADAVTDDLTTDLSRLSHTLVIARATAFTYKGRAVDARAVGREFGIRYMLEGSVGRVGTRVQANAELIDTSSAAAIWADRFNTDVTSLLELYEAVTGRIAASLHLQLVQAEYRRAVAERATDPNAVDLRLHAMALLTEKLTPENSLFARKFLEASLALDPHSAEAWSQLALVLARDVLNDWNHATREDLPRAEEALRKAFANAPWIALAHLADGYIHRLKGDPQGALDAFDRALELNPNLALAYTAKASQLIWLGRAKEAPALVKKAIAISPRDPDLGFFHNIVGRAFFAARNYDEAIKSFKKSIALQPEYWRSRAFLIGAYALAGRLETNEARTAVNEYRKKFKDWPLEKIQEWFDKLEPDPPRGFAATLRELYQGLEKAGL
jgi:class 3 adenylate cyclase/TolB-like protein/Flp pilus assembly protein TadD